MLNESMDELEDRTQIWEMMDDDSYECMNLSCDFGTHDKSELKACIECGRVYCPEHLAEIGSEYYCGDCGVCKKCGSEALYFCEYCSDLLCPDHTIEVEERCNESGYHNVVLMCGRCKEDRSGRSTPPS